MEKTVSNASALAGYLRPIFEETDPESPLGRVIGDWCWKHQWVFDVKLAEYLGTQTKRGLRKYKHNSRKAMSKRVWKKLFSLIEHISRQEVASPLQCNVKIISDIVGLDALDTSIFTFAALVTGERTLWRLISDLIRTRMVESPDLIAGMINADATVVLERLAKGVLRQLNFIDGVEERPGQFELYVPYRTMDALRSVGGTQESIEKALLGEPARTRLQMSDYNHIASERDFAFRLLKGALNKKERGVNILLYGAPGVGKTELAKVLTRAISCDLFVVADCDEDGDEPDREERLAALCVADRLARKRGATVLLFDEMEDLLSGGDTSWRNNRRIRQSGSKTYFNKLLETNETPVIWTTNSIHEFDPAFLRRMMFSIELRTPSAETRSGQWCRIAQRSGISLSRRQANELASAHAVPPSYAQSAIHAVAAADGDHDDLDFVLRAVARPVGEGRSNITGKCEDFDLTLVNPDCDLAAIELQLRDKDCPLDVSFCFYGPPGTGKSALARHLATCMNLETLEKRSSDLLSPWIGETEQKIAKAFEQAADEKKLLLIDEAESLFWSRDGAGKSWEVSMVNEFLVNLERAPIPVICTTNHLDRIDPAALRRFTFKAKLDYLTPDQTEVAYKKFFEEKAPESLKRCRVLTLGDFAVVKKQMRFSSTAAKNSSAVVKMLEGEAAVKQRNGERIGF